ncbi:NAD(P)H dehydrogenase (quinone) [Pseudomonas duriflava]|uniref:NAD(P)H dehydrogenase (Quinone) n=1 Tax=Pseudomonas duriflava TaxID=459528 RepID=A0A562PL12_9PSED|nr:NAD(P)H-dependent oxidoreductase [Pseudomonas duriflava]TWI45109.1 NAD(P)H dehydrogenase (quinone) [Pseudomonas duriflava]
MNVLLIYAHPEPHSLNGALKNFSIQHLLEAGHQVKISDLYAMQWKATLDAADSLDFSPEKPFNPSLDSMQAYESGRQSPDIAGEQAKLLWADAVILQFPLWWFSMPAILKGWVDRVYAYGFAYGVGEHSDSRWGDRYGEGTLAGKRAMLVVTAGGWDSHYSPRGINGSIEDVLFPIQHGVLYYPGFDVLPPFVVYRTSRVDDDRYAAICTGLGERLDNLFHTAPIQFRSQNGGDYDIPALTLRTGIAPGVTGFRAHIAE